MSKHHRVPTAGSGQRPTWLTDAPDDLRLILELGYDKFGDDPPAIAAWLGRVNDYKQFWSIVDDGPPDLQERYQRDGPLQERIADARAHRERRVPRPPRRTA